MSEALESVTSALAEWAVARHAELDDTLAARYGDRWRARWVGDVKQRLGHLAQSIAVDRPELFAASAAWAWSAFDARDASADDLGLSLRCLKEVVGSELPGPLAATAVGHIDAALGALNGSVAPTPASSLTLDGPHGALAAQYLEALLSGERVRAERLIIAAADDGADPGGLALDVLVPVLAEAGRMWHLGEITIADEHFVTASTEIVLSRLRGYWPEASPRGRTVVASAVAGDLHGLGVRLVADFFEMDGWNAILLGANTPTDDIIRSLVDHRADLLALSAASVLSLRTLADAVACVRGDARLSATRVIVGGGVFALAPGLWRDLGADGCAESAAEAVTVANGLFENAGD